MGVSFFYSYGTIYFLEVLMEDNEDGGFWGAVFTIFLAAITIGFVRGIGNDD